MTEEDRHCLDTLLDRHRPLDDEERRHLETIRDFARQHVNPFDRRISMGHFTGAAFVLDPRNRLLLNHHRRLDIWIQLGGHAEEGEHRADLVAMREAREESGLDDLAFHHALIDGQGAPLLLDVDVHPIPARKDEPAHQHLDLRFLLRTLRPEEIRKNESESKALEWVSLAEARERCDPGILRAIAKIEALG